ncbi:hypothetical protein LPC10_17690 [Methylorubrum sp. B1-46]|uniref:hypothetical protein n=1 Tax=Methylorubrum TaxID=2282523 RepID=UPI001E47C438|nr:MULTISPECIES: hypothetical protein [Methylorubrum]MCG5246875.1 hypothetical protein [Methylorubrum extorquens]UGB24763.1 hypothetical protein LPC10_17690 [Methylorubrum sp. B1-46]
MSEQKFNEIGAAVFVALTAEDKAKLAEHIRDARASLSNEYVQVHDWLCIIMQHYFEPAGFGKRIKRVTNGDILETCINLAIVRPVAGCDWYRLLSPFYPNTERVSGLFDAAADGKISATPSILRQALEWRVGVRSVNAHLPPDI